MFSGSTFMTITAKQDSRPATVKVAVIILLFSIGIGTMGIPFVGHFKNSLSYIFIAVVVCVQLLFVWFISLGKNWARWIFIISLALGLVMSFSTFRQLQAHSTLYLTFFYTQTVLHSVAAIALLLRPSNDWFRGCTNAA